VRLVDLPTLPEILSCLLVTFGGALQLEFTNVPYGTHSALPCAERGKNILDKDKRLRDLLSIK